MTDKLPETSEIVDLLNQLNDALSGLREMRDELSGSISNAYNYLDEAISYASNAYSCIEDADNECSEVEQFLNQAEELYSELNELLSKDLPESDLGAQLRQHQAAIKRHFNESPGITDERVAANVGCSVILVRLVRSKAEQAA